LGSDELSNSVSCEHEGHDKSAAASISHARRSRLQSSFGKASQSEYSSDYEETDSPYESDFEDVDDQDVINQKCKMLSNIEGEGFTGWTWIKQFIRGN